MFKKLNAVFVALAFAVSLNAWPWSSKSDRAIDASSKEILADSLNDLKKDLSSEDFRQLLSSISWITFYEGTIIGVGGRYDPGLGVKHACAVINGKSTKQVCEYAEKLAKESPRILEAYKQWLAAGAP